MSQLCCVEKLLLDSSEQFHPQEEYTLEEDSEHEPYVDDHEALTIPYVGVGEQDLQGFEDVLEGHVMN